MTVCLSLRLPFFSYLYEGVELTGNELTGDYGAQVRGAEGARVVLVHFPRSVVIEQSRWPLKT